MAILNFFSNLTYENILSPMILSRSGGNNNALGIVSGVLGVGGILGGIIVSFAHLPADKIKLIYFPAAFSFLFGDLLMGIGQNTPLWIAAALAASIPISLVTAGQNVLMYNLIPQEIQGRVFSFRNAVQYFTIPLGTLLGGALADFIFEPFMKCTSGFPAILHRIVGNGSGSGMAVMFLCTGVLGFISSILWYNNKQIRLLQQTL
jgi:predicted MFS family arabinose efflux permease